MSRRTVWLLDDPSVLGAGTSARAAACAASVGSLAIGEPGPHSGPKGRLGHHPDVERFDSIVAGGVSRAAGKLVYVSGERPECLLDREVRQGLRQDERVSVVAGTPKYLLRNWTRPPGGVDVVLDLADGTGQLAIELKVSKPDESIWDAIKLADVQVFDSRVRAGYLVSDNKWLAGAEGSELFEEIPPRAPTCRDLIAASPAAWTGTMIGGRGIRPRTSVGGIKLTFVARATLKNYGDRDLITVRVLPRRDIPEETYDAQGFPIGYEPPAGLRAKVVRADEHLARTTRGCAGASECTDPCHGYPWFRRWSQQRIELVLRCIGEDPAARACLRRRLALERNWEEDELRERFDPYYARRAASA